MMQKREARLCPSCGLFYADHPAVSRKDARILICPDCGTKEALAEFSFSRLFGPTMEIFEQAHKAAESCRSI